MDRVYRVGSTYIDRGKKTAPDDQFLRWIHAEGGRCIQNTSGIRVYNYQKKKTLPAAIFLVTNRSKTGSGHHNPWEDIIDHDTGTIYYWGDAKWHPTKRCDDFPGNKIMKRVFDHDLEKDYSIIPPILHFTKPEQGKLEFNGLCTLDNLEYSWIEDRGKPVRNYRMTLRILDVESVELKWLKERSINSDNSNAPNVWKKYVHGGRITPLIVWKRSIRTKEQQLPDPTTTEYKLLEEVCQLSPQNFERFTVELLKEVKYIKHQITQTRPTADGGFDFFGSFTLPHPLNYQIDLKGEAKKWAPETRVEPKHVSRLVARLGRGEYGIFITTSYYTKQAQAEVISDGYPVKLISGLDLINIMKEYNFIAGGRLTPKFSVIIDEREGSNIRLHAGFL